MKGTNNKINAVTMIIVLVLGILAFGLKKCRESNQQYDERSVTTAAGDWRHHKIIYTSHARCRMECREISESEVEYILANGTINEEKSKEENEEALEGDTKDGQHVRIIFGACEKITKVITAIDLGVDHVCNCR
jgi:hypothetical protein